MSVNYCSDIVHKACRAAHQQAMNQFSFNDLRYIINQQWRYVYERIVKIDGGFFNTKVRLTSELTHLDPMVLRSVRVYRQDPYSMVRQPFRHGDNTQYSSRLTYYIEGNDLLCKEAAYSENIWCEFTPAPKELFFTMDNRNPEYLQSATEVQNPIYHSTVLSIQGGRYIMSHITNPSLSYDITPVLYRGDFGMSGGNTLYDIVYITMSYPYCFITYKHKISGMYQSYILKNIMGAIERVRFNPFDYTGRISNVKYVDVKHNEDNGMYAIVEDYDDTNPDTGAIPAIKKIGWTPDTVISFPHDCVFDMLVAQVARRIANKNETELRDIEQMLKDAELEMNMWLRKDGNNFYRIQNTVGRRWSDTIW